MSNTLKDRLISRKEQNKDESKKDKTKDRLARSTVRNKIQHLDPEDWDDIDLEPFEKM